MKLLFTRPAQWAGSSIDGLRLVHAPVFGGRPVLRDGHEMADNVGGVATREGLARLIEQFEELKPDAFLFWPMYGQGDQDKRMLDSVVKALMRCRRASPKTVFFYGNGNQVSVLHDRKPDFNVLAFANVIDVVLDNNEEPSVREIYRKAGFRVDTLYSFGFDPAEIVSRSGEPADHDVFFGGSYTGRSRFPNSAFRHGLFVRMALEFDSLFRGRGKWPKVAKQQKYVHGLQYPVEIARCRVALGCNHADLNRYYTKRTIYSLASGRPYVVRYIPGMERDFTNGCNLVWYWTINEAVAAVRKLLKDPDRAKQIGLQGRQTAEANHSWAARLRDMEKILGRHL